ncbi:TPA: hypothetical protein ACKRQV_001250 [Pseudomonas aeruginosa]
MSTALKLALEALKLAAECGGELDQDDYREAHQKLQEMVDSVVEHDREMDRQERVPDGDDYNTLLALLGLGTSQRQDAVATVEVNE